MQTVMYTDTIFGPIHSRRLGSSLGVNLMPRDGKICSFDCLYCEAGFNAQGPGKAGMPSREQVRAGLEVRLAELKEAGRPVDNITFSGNGEPTLHPDFAGVIDDTIALRDRYYPGAGVSVLSNATMLHRPEVVEALRRVDHPILKLDSAVDATAAALDRPVGPYSVERVISQLHDFGPQAVVQTMITRGDGVDNTTEAEIDALIDAYRRIAPGSVMLYTIDRPTPDTTLKRVPRVELDAIAERITAATGLSVQVSG
ncbi:MAG: radical SAM protein [Bacteroides sp.]|nr:radical SAM protein [Bacteroides sp.]MCM1096103.1 radical SAM protein [Terasakiella sp.]